MIEIKDEYYLLHTAHTTYAFAVMETGQLEHLYYGKRIHTPDPSVLREEHAFAPGNTVSYDNDHTNFTLEDMCLEVSGYGKGDIREPFVEVSSFDGATTTDFVFESASQSKGKEELVTLPSSYDESGEVEHLCVVMKDRGYGYTMELHYYVFEDCDVITRQTKFINTSDHEVRLNRLMSTQLDFNRAGFVVTTFHGHWTREMNAYNTKVDIGRFVNQSVAGSTSNRANNFIMLCDETTSEDIGDAYGLHLVYSGNHYESIDVNSFDKTRVVTGINPATFSFLLEVGEEFEAPEAVLTYSSCGKSGMSANLHAFIREHIVRGTWKKKPRPVLLNSWEAAYFDISESSLLKLAKAGKEIGIELFVMDDGWFGERNDDKHALGDWHENTKKLPNGVAGLCKKINDLGMDFGIWIEPEMVNVDSDLYRSHPEWCMEIPGKDQAEGRNQRFLDFANPEVVDYMTDQMKRVLHSANIAYVKWDMNRIFSDVYSKALPANRQGEVAHRYVLGFYRLAKALTKEFPDILFEGCSAGGNRFDLGMLCYFPQIWGSDNTDAVSRLDIQNGYSYGYPLSTVTAHVSSCPNHQTLRVTPLDSRFAVASFGVLGYEINLCDASKEELEVMKHQIELYKKYREVWQYGDFHRVAFGNQVQWTVVSKDKKTAIGMIMQREVIPNSMFARFVAKGLDPDKVYHFYNEKKKYNIKEFGDLVNTAAPFHVKPNGVIHNTLAKFIKMDGETEEYIVSGDVLMSDGVKLKQGFVATGYSDQVRHFPDHASRLYFMEEAEEKEMAQAEE